MHRGIRTTLGSISVLLTLLLAATGCGSDSADSTATDAGDGAPSASPEPSGSASPSQSPSQSPSVAAPTSSPSLPSTTDATEAVVLPGCDAVWVVGQQLPRRYQGCTDDTGVVQADGRYCEFGKPLFTYAGFFYAVPNGPINKTASALAKDKTYQRALRTCGG